ncbi:MAG: bifunctional 2',3'-cyclic-nucleotide 2'-phosphodiesterase/3'-nucleotidase [Pseudomonadota bacterium]
MSARSAQHPRALILIGLLPALLLAGCGGDDDDKAEIPAGSKVSVAILATTDEHSNLLSYDYFKTAEDKTIGIERTATLIAQARKEFPNSILVSNGDTFQGTALSDYEAVVNPTPCASDIAEVRVMNALKYDAMVLGNHEFNYGLPYLDQVTGKTGCKGPTFPVLSSNVLDASTGQPRFKPYVILNKTFDGHPVKIGIFGITPPPIVMWDKRHLDGKVKVEGPKEAAAKMVAALKAEGADVILALNHGGMTDKAYDPGQENLGNYVAQVEGINAMILGHSHGYFPDGKSYANITGADNVKGTVNGVPTVMPGFWGNHLGVIRLDLEHDGKKWQVKSGKSEIRPIAIKDSAGKVTGYVDADPTIKPLIQIEHNATIQYVSTPIGNSELPIASFFTQSGDVAAMQLINAAQTAYVNDYVKNNLPQYAHLPVLSAAAPFKMNYRGSGYTDIPAGGVAIKNVADLYLYPNTVEAVKITGATLKGWLEKSAEYFNRIDTAATTTQKLINTSFPSYNFDVIDGVSYEIDLTQATGSRIKNLSHKGQAVTDAQEFIVATNNYRASGGGGFPGLNGGQSIFASPDTNRDIIVNFIKSTKTLTKANIGPDKNWRFTKIAPAASVTFQSACDKIDIAASEGIANITQVSSDKDENGDCTYSIDLSK